MPTKKSPKKEEIIIEEKAPKKEKYFYAVGRRKTAIARVKLYPSKNNQHLILANELNLEKYFPLARLIEIVKSPLALAGQENKFEVKARIFGGGKSAQADAVRLGIARALVKFDENLKKSLKDKGYLTRDAREVERKKPGLKKARRAPQWAKR